jgi:hypothetical protein
MRLICFMILSALLGCAPLRTNTVVLVDEDALPPEKPTDAPIRLFTDRKPPRCPYEELGLVEASAGSYITTGKVVEALRTKARLFGGDAIIGISSDGEVRGLITHKYGSDVVMANRLAGTVVRFTDPNCKP